MHFLDLGGEWSLAQANTDVIIPAQVPGCVHTDLLAAGRIDDPFYRDNESRLQWIGQVDWIYTKTFTVSADFLAAGNILLRCEGLDTLATVTLNGVKLGDTDNMFRCWEFNVSDFLREGENSLEISFASTLPYIARRQQEHYVASESPKREVSGRCWVRKEPCNFGWDWGPVLVTCGVWRPIMLIAIAQARLTDVHILQQHNDGAVTLEIGIAADTIGSPTLSAEIAIRHDGKTIGKLSTGLTDGQGTVKFEIENPRLWWPSGMGEQPLYEVEVTLRDEQGTKLDGTVKRIGLRTLKLDRHADEWGESFQFVVNGVPFFAKGGNWIPADTFANRVSDEQYRHLLQSMADANMNMVRVWGGGIYEFDIFYDLCDELGICVWQDFMFACSSYPSFDEHFMANVRQEAIEQVRRLRHHAGLALWCGNNELEMFCVSDEDIRGIMNWEAYGLLFDDLLKNVALENDPEHDYWPSSPHSPLGNRAEHSNPNCGDAHLWDVWHGRKPFEWYRTCEHRFASEFGFQSFPEPKTVRGYTQPRDRNITTYVMEHHQRSGIGNTTIISYMLDWYRLPSDFDMTLWLSQILHGMAMKYAVENWRRNMPRTMGTLYWQINDCWPVASWSSIDYHGRWKALHYLAKNFYTPLLISGVEDPEIGKVDVFVTSDHLQPEKGLVTWTLTDVAGAVLSEGREPVSIAPQANTQLPTLDFSQYLASHSPRDLMLWLALEVDGATVSTNFISFARPKHLELRDPEIDALVTDNADGGFTVTLSSSAPALWAWLEMSGEDARFSDNFIHIRPGAPVFIKVTPARPLTREEFEKQLLVRSLIDTYIR